MVKIEKATVTIKGKEISFLKPRAVDLIEIEDKCFISGGGELDYSMYSEELLKIVSPALKADELVVYTGQEISLSSGDNILIPEIGYKQWLNEMKDVGGFSRAKLAKKALKATGITGEISLDTFRYEDIDSLAMAFYKLYDASELNEVIDTISDSCFS